MHKQFATGTNSPFTARDPVPASSHAGRHSPGRRGPRRRGSPRRRRTSAARSRPAQPPRPVPRCPRPDAPALAHAGPAPRSGTDNPRTVISGRLVHRSRGTGRPHGTPLAGGAPRARWRSRPIPRSRRQGLRQARAGSRPSSSSRLAAPRRPVVRRWGCGPGPLDHVQDRHRVPVSPAPPRTRMHAGGRSRRPADSPGEASTPGPRPLPEPRPDEERPPLATAASGTSLGEHGTGPQVRADDVDAAAAVVWKYRHARCELFPTQAPCSCEVGITRRIRDRELGRRPDHAGRRRIAPGQRGVLRADRRLGSRAARPRLGKRTRLQLRAGIEGTRGTLSGMARTEHARRTARALGRKALGRRTRTHERATFLDLDLDGSPAQRTVAGRHLLPEPGTAHAPRAWMEEGTLRLWCAPWWSRQANPSYTSRGRNAPARSGMHLGPGRT